jgi:hypothetical protein
VILFVYYIQSFSASYCLFCFTSANPSHSFLVSQFLVFQLTGVATIGRSRWSVSGIADEDTSLHHDWRLGDVYHLLFTMSPLICLIFSVFTFTHAGFRRRSHIGRQSKWGNADVMPHYGYNEFLTVAFVWGELAISSSYCLISLLHFFVQLSCGEQAVLDY